jgi:hypothetical protein
VKNYISRISSSSDDEAEFEGLSIIDDSPLLSCIIGAELSTVNIESSILLFALESGLDIDNK